MENTNRRNFLKNSATVGVGIAAAGLSPRRIFSQESSGFRRLAYRNLGSTGFVTTEVGFGCMNMRDPELVTAAYDAGINYFDTAYVYMNGINEETVGKALKGKRSNVFLTTKIGRQKNLESIHKEIAESLKRLQTDYVDLVLLHVVEKRDEALNEDFMKAFDEIRRKGQARFIGISAHSNQTEAINAAVESNFWEAVLTGYNYHSPPELTAAIKNAREAGLAIIAMKSLITTERPRKPFPDIRAEDMKHITNQQALLNWVLEDKYVDTIIPGVTSFEQLADDIALMGMKMTFDDKRILRRYSMDIKDQYCCGVSGCTGCRDKCPKGVQVNEINRCMNYAFGYGDIALAKENYNNLPDSNRLDVCSDCDECQVKCINGLNLTENIRRASKLFA